MDSLTHLHSRNVYFYIHYSNSLKVLALDMFQEILGSHPLKGGTAPTTPKSSKISMFCALPQSYQHLFER